MPARPAIKSYLLRCDETGEDPAVNSAALMRCLRRESYFVTEIITFVISVISFPLVHLFSGWLFSFAEISPHIGLIYLPAFIRLFNVLVLGPVKGTLATFLGGFLLMFMIGSDRSLVDILNIACSAGGPLVAVLVFQLTRGRPAQIASIYDVAVVALIYCVANALLHHLMWSFFDPSQLASPLNLFWMALGDFNGALFGAYALKWLAARFRIGQT